jgi:hypothetical protein
VGGQQICAVDAECLAPTTRCVSGVCR